MAEEKQGTRDFSATFVAACPLDDATGVAALFSEAAEYRGGPLPPVIGQDVTVVALGQMMARGVRWRWTSSSW